MMFGFKSVKITGETTSANQEAANEFSDAIKKIIEEKRYLTEQVVNVDKSALFWKKKYCKGPLISKEEKRALGFKTGRDRLTLLFCADALGL